MRCKLYSLLNLAKLLFSWENISGFMSVYAEIIGALRGSKCNKLVKLRGQELSITGVKGGINNISIDVGAFSNKNVEFYKVTDVLVALDTNQYSLCQYIESLPENDPFRRDCERMRLQSILGFSQLQAIVNLKSDEQFKDEVENWINYMNELTKTQISALTPPQMVYNSPRIKYENSHGSDSHKGLIGDFSSPSNKGTIHVKSPDTKAIKANLKMIGEYQGIDEHELEEALNH
jgi:hypothetical protein